MSQDNWPNVHIVQYKHPRTEGELYSQEKFNRSTCTYPAGLTGEQKVTNLINKWKVTQLIRRNTNARRIARFRKDK